MNEDLEKQQALHEIFELNKANDKTIMRRDFVENFISNYLVSCNDEDFERLNDIMLKSGLEIEFKRNFSPDNRSYDVDAVFEFLKTIKQKNKFFKPILESKNLIKDINKNIDSEPVKKYRNFIGFLHGLIYELEFVINGDFLKKDLAPEAPFIKKHLSEQLEGDNRYLYRLHLRSLIKRRIFRLKNNAAVGNRLHFLVFDLKELETTEYYFEIYDKYTFIYKAGDSPKQLNRQYKNDILKLVTEYHDTCNQHYTSDNSDIYKNILECAKKIILKYNSDDIKEDATCTMCKEYITVSIEETEKKKVCRKCQEFLREIIAVNEIYNKKCNPKRKRSEDWDNLLTSFRKKKTRADSLRYCNKLINEVKHLRESEHLSKTFLNIFPEAKEQIN